jgi:hypothetical protein
MDVAFQWEFRVSPKLEGLDWRLEESAKAIGVTDSCGITGGDRRFVEKLPGEEMSEVGVRAKAIGVTENRWAPLAAQGLPGGVFC